jgi:hypothetical protein
MARPYGRASAGGVEKDVTFTHVVDEAQVFRTIEEH